MQRHERVFCLLVVAAAASGCLGAPRIGYVHVEQLTGAPVASIVSRQRWPELAPQVEQEARRHGINLVFNYSALVYASPDLDLTPLVQGHPNAAFRAGVRHGVVDLQRALDATREGQQSKARLQHEFDTKQADLDRWQRELLDKYGGDAAAITPAEREALKARLGRLRFDMMLHERKATKAILQRLEAEVQELARARGIDVVTEKSALGKDLLYRHWTRYPIGGPSLTDELIRLHDEHSRASLAASTSTEETTLPAWAQKCAAELMTAASKNPAFEKGKVTYDDGAAELRVDLSVTRAFVASLTVRHPGAPRKIVTEWISPARGDEPGFMMVKSVDGRSVTIAGSDAHDPLREEFEQTFKPILEGCLQY